MYIQALLVHGCRLFPDIPSGFSLWRCLGLSGHGVLWQLLHDESVDLSLIKFHSLCPSAVAALGATSSKQQQQQQKGQELQGQERQMDEGLSLLRGRVDAALQHLQQLGVAARRPVVFATHAEVKGMHLIEVSPFLECTYTCSSSVLPLSRGCT